MNESTSSPPSANSLLRTGAGIAAVLALCLGVERAWAQSINIAQNSEFDGATIAPWAIEDPNDPACMAFESELETGEYTTLMVSSDDYYCPSVTPYNLQLGQNVDLQAGHTYQISFWAQATYYYGNSVHVLVANPDTTFFTEENIVVPNCNAATDSYGIAYQSDAFIADEAGEAWFGIFLGNTWDMKVDSIMLRETPPGAVIRERPRVLCSSTNMGTPCRRPR